MTGFNRTNWDRKRMPKNNTMTFDFGFMVFPSFMSIICEGQNKEPPKEQIVPWEASNWNLQGNSLHNLLQKVRSWVVRLIEIAVGYFS